MTTIRVICTQCQVETALPAEMILLTLHENGAGHYEWACPPCGWSNISRADQRARALLTLAHSPTRSVRVPTEFLEPKVGPPITEDEMLDFACALSMWCEAEALSAQLDQGRQRHY